MPALPANRISRQAVHCLDQARQPISETSGNPVASYARWRSPNNRQRDWACETGVSIALAWHLLVRWISTQTLKATPSAIHGLRLSALMPFLPFRLPSPASSRSVCLAPLRSAQLADPADNGRYTAFMRPEPERSRRLPSKRRSPARLSSRGQLIVDGRL